MGAEQGEEGGCSEVFFVLGGVGFGWWRERGGTREDGENWGEEGRGRGFGREGGKDGWDLDR